MRFTKFALVLLAFAFSAPSHAGVHWQWPTIPVRLTTSDGKPAANVTMTISAWGQLYGYRLEPKPGEDSWGWDPNQILYVETTTDANGNGAFKAKSGHKFWFWRGPLEYRIGFYGVRVPGYYFGSGADRKQPCDSQTLDGIYESCPQLLSLTQFNVNQLAKTGIDCTLNITSGELAAAMNDVQRYCSKAK